MTKPWQLKAWREIRKTKIGDKCMQCGSTKLPLVLHHPLLRRSKTAEEFREYLSCEETVTFCKRCAFLWDMKGQNLCPKCRIHFKRFKFPVCFSCAQELNSGLKDWVKVEKECDLMSSADAIGVTG